MKKEEIYITYCTASSLVGARISTLIPGWLFGRKSKRSSTGKAKAAVYNKQRKINLMPKPSSTEKKNVMLVTFPDPVKALPHISRPVNAKGMQAA